MLVSLFCRERNRDAHLIISVIKGHAASTWQSLCLPRVTSRPVFYLLSVSFSIPLLFPSCWNFPILPIWAVDYLHTRPRWWQGCYWPFFGEGISTRQQHAVSSDLSASFEQPTVEGRCEFKDATIPFHSDHFCFGIFESSLWLPFPLSPPLLSMCYIISTTKERTNHAENATYLCLRSIQECGTCLNIKLRMRPLTLIDFRNKVELIHDTDLIQKYFHKIPEHLWELKFNSSRIVQGWIACSLELIQLLKRKVHNHGKFTHLDFGDI